MQQSLKTAEYKLKHEGLLTPVFAPAVACANPACITAIIEFSAAVVAAIVIFTKTHYNEAINDQGETVWIKKSIESDSQTFLKKNNEIDKKKELSFDKNRGGSTSGMPDPDEEPNKFKEWVKKFEKYLKNDGSNRYECESSESPQWDRMKPFKGKLKTNGKTGSDMEVYEWDTRHKWIEVVDKRGRYLGSRDPVTFELAKEGTGKVIQRIWNQMK